jgi:4-alpha-glucanotransferase
VYSQYVKKSIALAGNWLQVSYLFAAEAEGVFCTEINLAMPSCDGWGGRYIYRGQIPGGFGQLLELSSVTDITLDDDVLGGSVELKVSVPAELHAQPYYSVSQSEEGFEKIMQAVTLKLQWPVIVGALVVSLAINARQNVVTERLL